jgi:glyoxylase-like metal-dependent hydrolase (beta-lactamase superfamily II)
MKVFSLYEGSYSVDITKEFIPFDPEIHEKKDRPGSLFIHIHPFLIQTDDDLILLDTGLGLMKDGELVLHTHIKEQGFDPQDITLVLLSHLHKDHASGMTYEQDGKVKLSFPNAEYVIQRNEWENAFSNPNSDSYEIEKLEVLQRSGNLHLIEGSGKLNDFIHYELSGGHTQFHQVFLIEKEGEKFFFGGDEWPEQAQILRKFAAKYDFDGKKAMELRDEYAQRAAKEGWTCLFYHDGKSAKAKIQIQEDTYTIIRV